MTWRSFLRPATLLFLSLWGILLYGGQSRFFRDPGTFWHTVVGNQILSSRGFFDTDEFTFTHAGDTWIPHQWLGECVMAVVHKLDKFDSLLLATATLLAGLFTWLGVRLMRCGLHPSLAAVLVAFALAASSGHFHIRPHLASIVCFGVTMAFLCNFENRRIGLGRMVLLIPVYLLWSNIHGGVLGGLATFALAIVGWTGARIIGWNSPIERFKHLAILLVLFAACAGTAFVNPYGKRLPETWIDIYEMHSLPQLIQEHAPIDMQDRNAWMIVLLGVVYVGLLVGTLPKKPRIVWLLPLAWFALACMRIRHAPLFAVATLIAIADLFPKTRYAEALEGKGSDLFGTPEANPDRVRLRERLAACALPFVCLLSAVILQAMRVEAPVIGHGWAQLDPKVWPVELLDELEKHQFDRPGGTRIFNEYAYGGFLIYFAPGYRVFVDDRCELYGDAWLTEFIHAPRESPCMYIDKWEARYGKFDFALVNNAPGYGFADCFPTPEWIEVKRTDTVSLYRRNRD